MENLFTAIEKSKQGIEELKISIRNTENSNYYVNYGTESERQLDLKALRESMKKALSVHYGLLESLQISINMEKCDISEMERELILDKNKTEKI